MKQGMKELSDPGIASPPARGRGLKPAEQVIHGFRTLSPPARGRGLKQINIIPPILPDAVAPRAGAWIETF